MNARPKPATFGPLLLSLLVVFGLMAPGKAFSLVHKSPGALGLGQFGTLGDKRFKS